MTIVLSIVLVLSMLLPLASGSEPDVRNGMHYIALGDSIPSGNAFPTDENRPCQRDSDSYPWAVSREIADAYDPQEYEFSHIACSGSRTAVDEDLVIERCRDSLWLGADDEQRDECALKWLPNQVDEALAILDGRPTLVTITVGANDTGWTDPLGLIALMLGTDDEFRDAIDDVAEDVEAALVSEIERLVADPAVTVIVTDIYNPFNAESRLFELARMGQMTAWGASNVGDEPCTGTDRSGVIHRLSCAERAEYGLQALSAAIERATQRHPGRVQFVSLIESFRGHEAPAGVCGDAEPASGETWIRESASGGFFKLPDCFHPNSAGVEAIADLVITAWYAQSGRR